LQLARKSAQLPKRLLILKGHIWIFGGPHQPFTRLYPSFLLPCQRLCASWHRFRCYAASHSATNRKSPDDNVRSAAL